MKSIKYTVPSILCVFAMALFTGSCNISVSDNPDDGQEYFSSTDLTSSWEAYNDCVASGSGNAPNVTQFDWNNTSGFLKDYSDGSETSVSVSVSATNVTGWDLSGVGGTGMPQAGTDANDTFDGIVNLNNIASYNSSSIDWYYEITFSGLDPAKSYAFVTTGNRDETNYSGDDSSSRWTKYTISDADTYKNVSSSGVTEISEDVLKMNTGYNSVDGYVVAWKDITASDGSFSVRSENVGAGGPGEQYKSYGFQGFLFKELSE